MQTQLALTSLLAGQAREAPPRRPAPHPRARPHVQHLLLQGQLPLPAPPQLGACVRQLALQLARGEGRVLHCSQARLPRLHSLAGQAGRAGVR